METLNQKLVLVVDDNLHVAEITADMLRELGWKATTSNLDGALLHIIYKPDFALLTVNEPGENGTLWPTR